VKYLVLSIVITILAVSGYLANVHYQLQVKAQDDHARAISKIAQMDDTGRTYLDFSDLRYLDTIPQELTEHPNIVRLNISNTNINDLSPLSGITTLQYLSIDNVPIQDLAPLSNLENLRTLSISRTWIHDLEPLRGLHKLQDLNLSYTSIRSLEPIMYLKWMRQLTLHKSHAHDGSKIHFDKLNLRVERVNNGNAYQQNWQPGILYRLYITLQRFKLSWMVERPQIS